MLLYVQVDTFFTTPARMTAMLKFYGSEKRVGHPGRCAQLLSAVLAALLAAGVLSGCVRQYQDSNVQSFEPGGAVVLDGKQLYLTYSRNAFDDVLANNGAKITPEWGYPPYYYRAVSEQREFLVDPAEHAPVDFSASDPFLIPGSDGDFPTPYSGTYIGSDGTISFSEPGLGNGNLAEHFSTRQISLLPIDATVDGARVTYGVLPTTLVVTYENVGGSSVQFIMGALEEQQFSGFAAFHPDDIIITYQQVSGDTRAGVVGISWLTLRHAEPAFVADLLADFEDFYGGEVKLAESTNTTSGGRVFLPLP